MLQIVAQMTVLKEDYLDPLEPLFAERAYTQTDPSGHKHEMTCLFHAACRQLLVIYSDICNQVYAAIYL